MTLHITGTYRTHTTTADAMRDLLNAHPHLESREVDGWVEVKIQGVLWRAPAEGWSE